MLELRSQPLAATAARRKDILKLYNEEQHTTKSNIGSHKQNNVLKVYNAAQHKDVLQLYKELHQDAETRKRYTSISPDRRNVSTSAKVQQLVENYKLNSNVKMGGSSAQRESGQAPGAKVASKLRHTNGPKLS